MKNKSIISTFFSLCLIVITLSGCAERAFKSAKIQNTIYGYDHFLQKYGNSDYSSQVKKLREDLKYKEAKETNTISSYDQYLKEFPKGSYVTEANNAKESLKFNEAKETNTISSYDQYLKEFPKGSYVTEANNRVAELKAEKEKEEVANILTHADGSAKCNLRVFQIQRLLNEQGFDVGKPDGFLNSNTRAAIEAFQREHELDVTGKLDNKTIHKIFISSISPSERMAAMFQDIDIVSVDTSGKNISRGVLERLEPQFMVVDVFGHNQTFELSKDTAVFRCGKKVDRSKLRENSKVRIEYSVVDATVFVVDGIPQQNSGVKRTHWVEIVLEK